MRRCADGQNEFVRRYPVRSPKVILTTLPIIDNSPISLGILDIKRFSMRYTVSIRHGDKKV